MLNLSQLARESSDYPLFRRIRGILDNDIYLAKNVKDYWQNAPSLKFPSYKRFPFLDNSMDRAYILFQNVGLKKLKHGMDESSNWFVLHDDSGQEIVYWNAEEDIKYDDWVCDVFVKYYRSFNLSGIVRVNKYCFLNKESKRSSLHEKIRSFFCGFN